jgi:hypothetical protein
MVLSACDIGAILPAPHVGGLPQRKRRIQAVIGTSEAKDQGKSIVYSSKLVGIETSGGTAETLRIDNGRLLDEDSRLGAVKLDHRAEHGRAGARRGW